MISRSPFWTEKKKICLGFKLRTCNYEVRRGRLEISNTRPDFMMFRIHGLRDIFWRTGKKRKGKVLPLLQSLGHCGPDLRVCPGVWLNRKHLVFLGSKSRSFLFESTLLVGLLDPPKKLCLTGYKLGNLFFLSPAFSKRSFSTDPKRKSPSQGMEHRLFFNPTSPDQFFSQREHLAVFANAADLANNLIASVDASAKKAVAFFYSLTKNIVLYLEKFYSGYVPPVG